MARWLQQGYTKKQHLAYYKQDAVLMLYRNLFLFG